MEDKERKTELKMIKAKVRRGESLTPREQGIVTKIPLAQRMLISPAAIIHHSKIRDFESEQAELEAKEKLKKMSKGEREELLRKQETAQNEDNQSFISMLKWLGIAILIIVGLFLIMRFVL